MKKLAISILLIIFTLQGFSANPEATDVTILGSGLVGTTLTGHYYYDDADIDAEGSSLYQWYRDGVAIASAESKRYTLTASDENKDITFKVTPYDSNNDVGTAVISSAITASSTTYSDLYIGNNTTHTVANSDTENHLNITGHNNAEGLYADWNSTLHIYGDVDLSSVSNFAITGNGEIIIHGQLIVNNHVTIYVHYDTKLTVMSGITADNGADLDIDGDVIVGGDLNITQNAVINVHYDSTFEVQGDLNLGDNGNFTINGDLEVLHDIDTGSGSTITTAWDTEVTIGGNVLGSSAIGGNGDITVGGKVVPPASVTSSGTVDAVVLPIELISFTTNTNQNNIQINWATASEINNDFFTIERSTNGINFVVIETIEGAGNSSLELNYETKDYSPIYGTSYYRLKQTDYDGQYSYSDIVSVFWNGQSSVTEGELNIYPNPYQGGDLILSTENIDAGKNITVSVYDTNGKIIYNTNTVNPYNQGINLTTIQNRNLSKGMYFVSVSYDQNVSRIKLVIE